MNDMWRACPDTRLRHHNCMHPTMHATDMLATSATSHHVCGLPCPSSPSSKANARQPLVAFTKCRPPTVRKCPPCAGIHGLVSFPPRRATSRVTLNGAQSALRAFGAMTAVARGTPSRAQVPIHKHSARRNSYTSTMAACALARFNARETHPSRAQMTMRIGKT